MHKVIDEDRLSVDSIVSFGTSADFTITTGILDTDCCGSYLIVDPDTVWYLPDKVIGNGVHIFNEVVYKKDKL